MNPLVVLWSTAVLPVLVGLADKRPDDDDVVAGPWGAAVFVFLIVAGFLLFRSLSKQLRRARQAQAEGVYGDPPAAPTSEAEPAASEAAGPNDPRS